MSGSSKPGPLCAENNPMVIDAGTLNCHRSPSPRPVGLGSRPTPIVLPATDIERAQLAALRAMPKLPAGIRDEVAALLTKRGLAMLGAATAIFSAGQFIGIGEVVDLVAGGVAICFLERDSIEIGREFRFFWEWSNKARTEADLDIAADHFARAVSKLSFDTLTVFLAGKGAGRGLSAENGVQATSRLEIQLQEAAAQRDWRGVQKMFLQVAEKLAPELKVPSGKLVLYSGVKDRGIANLIRESAQQWAKDKGKLTLEMTPTGATLQAISNQLVGRFRWVEDIRPGWAHLSEKLATQAEGEVDIFVAGEQKVGAEDWNFLGDEKRMPEPPKGVPERRAPKNLVGARPVLWEIEYPELKTLESLKANPKVNITFHVRDSAGKFHLCDSTGKEIN